MSSISVPCPKCYLISRHGEWCGDLQDQLHQSKMVRVSNPNAPLLAGSTRIPLLKVHNRSRFPVFKAQVQEVTLESKKFPPLSSTKLENPSNGKEVEEANVPTGQATASDSNIISFMAEVSNLVRLVDSKDITELRLKKKDIELIIRKKEALPQPAPPTHFFTMQPPQQAFFPHQTQSPLAVPPPSPAGPSISASPPALPPTKGSKSSVPPLKCPMAGTFYRCPGPGETPFVKVGDKVQKGQVVCIIEAMKLMNEIEADQSGTVVEILVEDGKPVSLDMPLFIIKP